MISQPTVPISGRERSFQRNVIPLPARKAAVLREHFIETFLDTKKDFFQRNIRQTKRFSDGVCYTGYLWDCIVRYSRISLNALLRKLLSHDKVYVMWDVHSCERILMPNYWLFPKDAVLEVNTDFLASNLAFLPQDIYIFDDSFRWALIPTHEYDEKGDILLSAKPAQNSRRRKSK